VVCRVVGRRKIKDLIVVIFMVVVCRGVGF